MACHIFTEDMHSNSKDNTYHRRNPTSKQSDFWLLEFSRFLVATNSQLNFIFTYAGLSEFVRESM